ncbi:MAG: selenocysteine-specific translation elongation factor, partial [Xanthobacteraceae bacterium]|nr:selenocysteine-specific translation elongation factor [Xanthobacteraceae bacterium]
AGATGSGFALLVVGAEDGVMPQTLEHLAIVNLLGIRHGMVALTKSDLADAGRRAEVTAEIADTVAGTALAGADIVPVSTVTGEGIDALRAALFRAAVVYGARAGSGRFRLAVDRSFTLTGAGTIVTGTVLSGTVTVGDRVTVSPAGLSARVRTIHAQNRPTEHGQAGERCALNLAGEAISREAITRGDVVLDPALHAPTARIDATLRVLAGERRPVSHWLPVRLHHSATEVGARVALLDEAPIAPGAEGRVQLVLDTPLAAAVGDRFVLRDTSAQRTIGGGRFVDLRGPARRRRTAERKAQLDAHALENPQHALAALLACAPHYVDLWSFARDRALAAAELEKIIAELKVLAPPVADARLGVSEATARDLKATITSALGAFHREHAEAPGLDVEQLRRTCAPRFSAPLFRALLQVFAEARALSLEGATVRLPTHSVQLRPQDEKLFARIKPLLSGAERFRPPRVRDLATTLAIPEQQIRALSKQLAKLGRLDEVAPDHFFLRTTVAEMAHMLPGLAAAAPGGEFSAAQLRDRLDNGRKVAIQILEFFDRHGLTARRGDLRRINAQRINLFGPEPSKQTTESVSSTAARRPGMAQTPSRSHPSSARTPNRH